MSDIKVTRLKYPDDIRQNVGMYLSETNNFTTPLREIINNSVDELINGHGTWLRIVNDHYVKLVVDNGRGIPVYIDSDNPDKTILHGLITETHVGGKFANFDEKTGGLHGVGSTAVNAVSANYYVMVNLLKKDLSTTLPWIKEQAEALSNPVYVVCYKFGRLSDEKVINKSELVDVIAEYESRIPDDFSTAVYIVPDETIYTSAKSKVSVLPLKLVAFENQASTIYVNEEPLTPFDYKTDILEGVELFQDTTLTFDWDSKQDKTFTEFHYNRKLAQLNAMSEVDLESAIAGFSSIEQCAKAFTPYLQIKVFFGYMKDNFNYANSGLINLIENPAGGYMEKNLSSAIGVCLHKLNSAVTLSDAKVGLNLFSVSYTNAKMKFSSQTKEKLVDIMDIDERMFRQCVEDYLINKLIPDNQDYFDMVVRRIIEYKARMNSLSSMEFIKNAISYGDDADRSRAKAQMAQVFRCRSRDRSKIELYITEGKSASGNIVKYRNRETQSVMPLRGKLWNTSTTDTMSLVSNSETLAIVNEIGIGVGNHTKVESCRYSKIIIATDLDPDGSHIANLILGLFLTHTTALVEHEKVYKLEAPFYVVTYKGSKDPVYYYYNEKDQIDFDNATSVKKRKGLGSYTEAEVQQFLVDPNKRRLVQIKITDLVNLEQSKKLLFSSVARKQLMIDNGILSQ